MEIRTYFDGKWVSPEFLTAALEDIVDMLGTAATSATTTQTESYTWTFRNMRGRYVTLEITARRAA